MAAALVQTPDATKASGSGNTIGHFQWGRALAFEPSMQLDVNGYPAVSFILDQNPLYLHILRCNDPSCLGGDDGVGAVDTAGDPIRDTSLALDALGNPVVAFSKSDVPGLYLLHCNDPTCSAGDDSISAVDTATYTDFVSLVLDGSGRPVVSYYDNTTSDGDLKLLHCNDANCTGGDESIVAVDTAGITGYLSSLTLDGSGNPVISYFYIGVSYPYSGDLIVIHCNDPNCAGNDESRVTVDSDGWTGLDSSLVLDAAGNPVVSYWNASTGSLKIAHCNDPNCAGKSITSPALSDGWTSLALDGAGHPVVAYIETDFASRTVSLLHCADENCAGGGESVTGLDEVLYSYSLRLDSSGNPVIAYTSLEGGVKVFHCSNPTCATGSAASSVGTNVSVALGSGVTVTFANVTNSGTTALSVAKGPPLGLKIGSLYYDISTTADYSGSITVCIDYDGAAYTPTEEAALRLGHYENPYMWFDVTTSLDAGANRICGRVVKLSPFAIFPLVPGQDADNDGCPNEKEFGPNEHFGGRRSALNPWDYFNPTHDGQNRVDDILVVVQHFGKNAGDPGYSTDYDRTAIGPNPWNLGPPNGQIRVDDILEIIQQFHHDCS